MAINRLWQAGAETGATQNNIKPEYDGTVGSVDLDAEARSGTWSWRVHPLVVESFWKDIPDTAQTRVGFAVHFDAFGNNNDGEILTIHDGATQLIDIELVIATGDLRLKVAGSQEDITIDAPLIEGVWYHFGIDCKIDAAAGWVKVYLDQNEILSLAGNTGAVNIDRVRFGTLTDVGTTGQWYYDDIYIDDSTGEGAAAAVEDKKFAWIAPNATGNYDDWVGSDANNVDNWALVDERPPNVSDYVEEDTVDQFDSYAMTTYAIGAGEVVQAVIPTAYAQRFGASEELALGTRYSGTDVIGSDQDPGSGAWWYTWERQTTKPGGGAWNQAAIDDVEVVLKSRGVF